MALQVQVQVLPSYLFLQLTDLPATACFSHLSVKTKSEFAPLQADDKRLNPRGILTNQSYVRAILDSSLYSHTLSEVVFDKCQFNNVGKGTTWYTAGFSPLPPPRKGTIAGSRGQQSNTGHPPACNNATRGRSMTKVVIQHAKR